MTLAGWLAAASTAGSAAPPRGGGEGLHAPATPVAALVRAELGRVQDAEIEVFYAARAWRPVWVAHGTVRPEADALIGLLAEAEADGLDPARYDPRGLTAAVERARAKATPETLAAAELALSRAFAAWVVDLRTPAPGAETVVVDAAAIPEPRAAAGVLRAAAAAPSLSAHLAEVRRRHPVYEALRDRLAAQRAAGGSAREEALIRANLERARTLPANPGRHVLVDAAEQRLHLYEDGRPVDSMKVVVGQARLPTPMLAGVIRYAVFDPYWNMPPDLVREQVARDVLRFGPEIVEARGLEVLSDWTPRARPLDAAAVDWAAVAAGTQALRVRQRPGPNNTMGRVKFMLPNDLGIYLHDTPDKAAFGRGVRTLSAGCVRVEDPDRLARWLFGGEPPSGYGWERREDLPRPVPVYITYLTAAEGLRLRRDVYGRDPGLLAALGPVAVG